MDVSLEIYRDIVRNVARRADIAVLCGVNRGFRNAGERALYNTLTISDDLRIFETLASSPRIASLVVALTIQVRRRHSQNGSEVASAPEEGEEEEQGEEASEYESAASEASLGSDTGVTATARLSQSPPLDMHLYWSSAAAALRNTMRLQHLTLDIVDPEDGSNAWVLNGCSFKLRTFHCDFDWDPALCAFLATQSTLCDLALRDFRELEPLSSASADDAVITETLRASASSVIATPEPILLMVTDVNRPHTPERPIPPEIIDTPSTSQLPLATTPAPPHQQLPALPFPVELPSLTTLECTFSAAAVALVPNRPVSRLKTCFSRSDVTGKRAEMTDLIAALRQSAVPFRALDIADSSYTESGTMELLHRISHTQATSRELRYLGTLVLPIGGRKRLNFYGLLRRLHLLRCIEVDVSAWNPPPSSSPAFRALAAELRLYCPEVHTVVFVRDFERTVVNTGETGVLKIDDDTSPELFWRDI
ncbi:hypothetical protein R3P38DRAFT_3190836 [Favolaschia claudopus]|uniref:F-box domain-containing protein n=1 Tax=Favolaschia claudopus TaxID=2862362 RepID=A0AAW0BP53_9AGAR